MNTFAVDVCNEALATLGAHTILSLQEPSSEARLAYRIYPGVRDSLLSMFPWSFATRRRALIIQKVQYEEDGDETLFVLPGECLVAIKCQRHAASRPIPYTIRGTTVACRSSECMLTYVAKVHEQIFPVYFRHALRSKLLASFSLALSDGARSYRDLSHEADRALQDAKRIETAQDTPPVFEDFSLLAR